MKPFYAADLFLRKQFGDASGSVYEARKYVYLAIALFFAGTVIGLLFADRFDPLLDSFKVIAKRFRGRSAAESVLMIFFQNISAVVLSVLLGVFWGLVPLVASIMNGILAGVVISFGMKSDLMTFLWKLLPHGVFELPAVFLSWGLGIWLGAWAFRHDRHEALCERVKRAFQVIFVFVLPLLMIAAVIEGLGIAALAKR